MHIVAAPDKFKGTASAAEIAEAIARAAEEAGVSCTQVPMADGGEGTLAALGGANRTSIVTGPLGETVEAEWRLERGVAVLEMAQAAGLVLAGGADGNDPLGATTTGVGELIDEAVDAGASTIIVGVGGSATTDGGLGALNWLGSAARVQAVELIVACDVRTRFLQAASVFGPQKGASPAQVSMLHGRLSTLAASYLERFGVDVTSIDRSGAAGGLAGGLAAIGATLVDGFDVVAEQLGLDDAIAGADLVITGEGFIDDESFDGKVVGGVASLAASHDVPVLAIAGQVFDDVERRLDTISLSEVFGMDRAVADPVGCIFEAVVNRL
ncbi:MAG: glycerate kinase [Verrucomicrobiales bacterium]